MHGAAAAPAGDNKVAVRELALHGLRNQTAFNQVEKQQWKIKRKNRSMPVSLPASRDA
jgi:hypothetical protein